MATADYYTLMMLLQAMAKGNGMNRYQPRAAAYRPSEPGENPYAEYVAARNRANAEAWSGDWRSQLGGLGYAGWLDKQMPGAIPSGPPPGFTGTVYGTTKPPVQASYSVTPNTSYGRGFSQSYYPSGDVAPSQKETRWTGGAPGWGYGNGGAGEATADAEALRRSQAAWRTNQDIPSNISSRTWAMASPYTQAYFLAGETPQRDYYSMY